MLREIEIEAESPDQAIETAKMKLGAEEDNLVLTTTPTGSYHVTFKNADAVIVLDFSADLMQATLKEILPHIGNGAPISESNIHEKLKEAGLGIDPDEIALKGLLAKIEKEERLQEIVVAEGTPPVPPKDAKIEFTGDLTYPVFPKSVFAKKIPGVKAQAGVGVDGSAVEAENNSEPNDLALKIESGALLDGDGEQISSTVFGMAIIDGDKVRVEPLINVAKDKLKAYTTLYPIDFQGNEIKKEAIYEEMEKLEITTGIRKNLIDEAFEEVKETRDKKDYVVLAEGTAPKHGKDAEVELIVGKTAAGKLMEDGQMDFKEIGRFKTVPKNSPLGFVVPAEKGVHGVDIFGKPLQARDGNPPKVKAGEGVLLSPEDNKFYAKLCGMAKFEDDVVTVTNCCEIEGDVDYSTGNVDIQEGSLEIKGSILNEFKVFCKGDINVAGCIEGAIVEAFGNIVVGQGLAMGGDGLVKSGKDLTISYATNAKLESGGDVIVGSSLTNSKIKAVGRIIATNNQGKIQGGEVVCGGGLEALEIGSASEENTVIRLEDFSDENLKVDKEIRNVEKVLSKIKIALGNENAEILVGVEDGKNLSELEKGYIQARNVYKKAKEIKKRLHLEFLQSPRGRVVVGKVLNTNTRVFIGGHRLDVHTQMGACTIAYSMEKQELVISTG